ncbi:MAG: hypothetical protein IJ742_05150, partial [Prevotella sp.]|nr:hypothetical protein [Prevotella sp.]
MVLLLKTGMREGELCALRWSDYDNELGTISISKTRYVAKDRANGGYKPAEDVVNNYHCRTIELSDD